MEHAKPKGNELAKLINMKPINKIEFLDGTAAKIKFYCLDHSVALH